MKKFIFGILGIVVFLIGFLIFKNGNDYYQNRYTGEIAYAKVPNKIPVKEKAKDSKNKVVEGIYTYKYNFRFVTKNGKVINMEHYLSGEDVKPLTPGSIIKAEVGKQLIVKGPNEVNKSYVPKNIVDKLN